MPFFTPGYVPTRNTGGALVTPPPPPSISFGGTIPAAIQTFVGSTPVGGLVSSVLSGGTISGAAVGAVIGSVIPGVGTVIGGLVGGLADQLGLKLPGFGTTSKANWRRTMGRVLRAALLGYVPEVGSADAKRALNRLIELWSAAGDSTGAKFWDKVVAVFNVPTEKGGTKEGFNSGAPAGSKTAEAMPDFKQLTPWLTSLGL